MVVYAIAVLGVCDGVFMRDVWFYFIIYYYVVILILLLGVNGLKYMKIYYTSIYDIDDRRRSRYVVIFYTQMQ